MLNSHQFELVKFVNETAPGLALAQRIRVYRGMADFLAGKENAVLKRYFVTTASILEEAEGRCAQLNLELPDTNHDGNHNP
jgi:hypothetical protein